MLICRVPEEDAGRGEPAEIARNCQTASELFELMTKDHDFEAGDDPLTTSDLVLLYKNIDLGNQLMSTVRKRSNQHVENVYHNDPETDSDLSESCSSEELRNIMSANKERIDLFTNPPLNSLCQKLGDLEIQVSNISNHLYDDRYFLNKDPYLKEQLQSLQLMTKANEWRTLFPTSLLDYICCKRLEDNYTFYMDNIITHVKHTIDQLKRISNGDYLPEKVKEKWRESDYSGIANASNILTTSISMPLQVKRKDEMTTGWNDIVHNEMDMRSLLKMMDKKIVLKVPRMISGSYKILSLYRDDKLIVSCSRLGRREERPQPPRVEAALSVERTPAGQLVSNIDSIVVLQPEHQTLVTDCTDVTPLEYYITEDTDMLKPKIIEVPETEQSVNTAPDTEYSLKSDEFGSLCSLSDAADSKDSDDKSNYDTDSLSSVPLPGSLHLMEQMLSTTARVVCAEAASDHATPNGLNFSIASLNRQTSLPDESTSNAFCVKTKKKSPERLRIKSPYENKSHIMEERKRRKLLEVKQRRERRQCASNDNSKITKNRNFPQAVSSVTKLSITNKAFYNSIYGRNGNGENAKRMSTTTVNNMKARKNTHRIDEEVEESEADVYGEHGLPGKNFKKNCNSNFLEDTETEMSYLQSKQDGDFLRVSTSTSVVSSESTSNLYPQLVYCSSFTNLKVSRQESAAPIEKESLEQIPKTIEAINKDPTKTSKIDNDKAPAVECRRSLEKIYTLMKKLQEIETGETAKKKALTSESRGLISESVSSLKRVSFSSPRLEKNKIKREFHKEDFPTATVHKVVISAKPQTTKTDDKNRTKTKSHNKPTPENPLKAISQLLHKFDNVQKLRPKIADPKWVNRSMSTENADLVKIDKRRSRIESLLKEDSRVTARGKPRLMREGTEVKPQVQEKRINDLIDEAKEARGEAVRGPPRFSSRLNALAQPKRAYVQALAGEFPRIKSPVAVHTQRPSSHSRARRGGDSRQSPVSGGAPSSYLERTAKPRRSAAGSPEPRARESPQFATLAAAAADALHTLKEKAAVAPPIVRRGSQRAAGPRAPPPPCDTQLTLDNSCGTDSAQHNYIGLKLHHVLSTILRAERPPKPTNDAKRVPSRLHTAASLEVEEEPIETKILTEEILVEKTVIEEVCTEETNDPTDVRIEEESLDVTLVKSVNELEKLEQGLQRNLSFGAFGGRLRVNKLTLSPRPSLQRAVMHQSGDTTLILKSSSTQKIQVTCQSSDQKSDLMGLLSRTRFDCGFPGFPLQISTVGCTFPTTECQIKEIRPRMLKRDTFETSDGSTSCMVRKKLSPTTAVMKYEFGKDSEHGSVDGECVIREIYASDDNKKTDVSSVSALTVGNSNSITASVKNCQPLDYTTSFDILVGLLKEIKTITACRSDGVNIPTAESVSSKPDSQPSPIEASSTSWGTISNSYKNYTRLDDRLESPVLRTKSVSAEAVEFKPASEDKGVSAVDELKYSATNATLQAGIPINIATSTCTNLPTSKCSVSPFIHSEFCDIGCNTLTSDDKINKQMGIETKRTSVKSLVPYYNNMFKDEIKKDVISSPENSVAIGSKRNVAAVYNILVDIAPVEKSKRILKKCEEAKNVNDKNDVKIFCPNANEFDSTLKMKRDILVSFYSILVLTVFAALAFPEMLQYAYYHV